MSMHFLFDNMNALSLLLLLNAYAIYVNRALASRPVETNESFYVLVCILCCVQCPYISVACI